MQVGIQSLGNLWSHITSPLLPNIPELWPPWLRLGPRVSDAAAQALPASFLAEGVMGDTPRHTEEPGNQDCGLGSQQLWAPWIGGRGRRLGTVPG